MEKHVVAKRSPGDAEREAEKPRYQRLGEELERRIEAGTYKIGDLLPTEIELCEEFDVSRYTVREALRKLIEGGLVQRRQGSGSQVIATKRGTAYVHSMRSLSELFQYATDTRFDILSTQSAVPGRKFAPYLGDGADVPWLVVEGVRQDATNGAPICFSIVLVNSQFAAIEPELRHHSGAIYSLIESRFGVEVADVEQEIRAEPIPRAAANALGVSVKMWAVRVVRRYIDARGQTIQVSVNYHPGDRFSYTMHLRRGQLRGG
jgi:DNA-binding GntR family transcriptional regulator